MTTRRSLRHPRRLDPASGLGRQVVLVVWLLLAAGSLVSVAAQEAREGSPGGRPDGAWILQRVDENIASDTKISRSRMIIQGRSGSRTVESQSWIRGSEESFTEYLAPPRDRGTKMLKLGDQLWTYFPSTDRTILIAGHMLRQSVMGSDLSYEDLVEDPHLFDLYSATLVREEEHAGRDCWVLRLEARDGSPAYASREMWVDRERFVPLKEHRYAKSGRLLKTIEVERVERQGDRWVAREMVFRDALKTGEGTRFLIDSIAFDGELPAHLLTKAALRR